MTIESSFVETPYGRFRIESAGQGQPVLFIHGGTASAREWRPVLPGLSQHARCVAIDRLGCGESDRSAQGYGRQTLTESLFACADALGFDRFAVVGQSFGGFWALSMAFARPDRLTGIVVVNGAGGPMTDEEMLEWQARRAAARQNVGADPEAAIERTLNEIFADRSRVPASFADDLRWQTAHAAPGQFEAVADEFVHLGRERYDQLNMPVLVVWGEADSMIPVQRGRRLAEAIPGARFVSLPGVGHTCQVEAPAEFVAAVAPFLDGLDRGD
jgi:pimeloyl-ACP methyl ester carboxylesterase